GSTAVTSVPRKPGDVGIAGIAAHLVAHDTVAWCLGRDSRGGCVGDSSVTSVELRYSPTADIVARGKEVSGGTVIALTPRASGLPDAQGKLAPYLKNDQIYEVAPADQAKLADAILGQVVAVARKSDGSAALATQVETGFYLDEQFAYPGP